MKIQSARNFLNYVNKRPRWLKLTVIIFSSCIVFFVCVGLILYLIFQGPVKQSFRDASKAKQLLETTQRQLISQQFTESRASLQQASSLLTSSHKKISRLSWMRYVPLAKTQYKAVEKIFSAADHVIVGIEEATDVVEKIVTPLQKPSTTTIKEIAPEDKQNVLKALQEAEPGLISIQDEFRLAQEDIDAIPKKGLLTKVNEIIRPIQDNIPKITATVNQIVPLSRLLPSFLGYNDQKSYLLLFQNNTELRPTGGFIGTYGIFKITNAEINSLQSDNVYNLDEAARKRGMSVAAPAPLFQYNKVDKLFLRDSNWSPDFPTSAKLAMDLYRQEGGTEKNIDGVIAIDPTLISSLLVVTGPLTVQGQTFTSENFTEKLQDHVTQDFKYAGINSSERKDIIGDLARALIEKLFSLPKNRWQELFSSFEQNLGEKHLLIWLTDENAQNILNQFNWDGHVVQDTNRLDVLVVDANLASLKTDPAIKRKTDITLIEQTDGTLAIELKRTYQNIGKLTWKTTRYRTYTRVYAPQGSVLQSAEGQMIDCKNNTRGTIEQYEELQHSVFAYFLCVEPGESKTITLTYTLPVKFSITKSIREIKLFIDKQSGTASQDVTLTTRLSRSVLSINPVDKTTSLPNNQLSASIRRARAITSIIILR